ncbi:MAG TPA: M20/M25/M40 family metallo-hydrolase, partial [Longimicrobiales bacterium]|nr:M20/M25/M40 family metallo-hydrolase [Longimicrobiales bacterium]
MQQVGAVSARVGLLRSADRHAGAGTLPGRALRAGAGTLPGRALRGAGAGALLLAGALAADAVHSPVSAQDVRCDDRVNPRCTEVARIAQLPAIVHALRIIEQQNDTARAELIALTEIPAPPFGETARAEAYAQMLREAGADSVHIDAVGNVIALRKGKGLPVTVALAGHLDTVFPEGTDVTVRESGDTLFAPGIGDDTRGLIVVLHVLRALAEADVRTDA